MPPPAPRTSEEILAAAGVPGRRANIHPIFATRLAELFQRHPYEITSGYRSSEEQQVLFDLFLAGRGNPANRPGESNHEAIPFGDPRALAADIHPEDGDFAGLHQSAVEVGIHFPTSEAWHAQPVEAERGFFTGDPFA